MVLNFFMVTHFFLSTFLHINYTLTGIGTILISEKRTYPVIDYIDFCKLSYLTDC